MLKKNRENAIFQITRHAITIDLQLYCLISSPKIAMYVSLDERRMQSSICVDDIRSSKLIIVDEINYFG